MVIQYNYKNLILNEVLSAYNIHLYNPMAFSLFSFSPVDASCFPSVLITIISEFNDERNVNRSKFISMCLEKSDKFKKLQKSNDNSACLLGVNNIVALTDFTLKIFSENYREEIFNRVNPINSDINHTLKKLKETNNANDIYQKQKDDFQKIILKKCKKIISRSSKYKSFDIKIKVSNNQTANKVSSLYKQIINNIDNLWTY
uniref:Uncharacterized protein n=1 Tax=viral metagenome TaxID=1070528 RepID=A0A6C0B4S6_9ZZZZ